MQRSYFYILDAISVSHIGLDYCYVPSSSIINKKVWGMRTFWPCTIIFPFPLFSLAYKTVKEHPAPTHTSFQPLYFFAFCSRSTELLSVHCGKIKSVVCRVFSYCSPFLSNDLLVDNDQSLLKPLNLNSKTTVNTDGKKQFGQKTFPKAWQHSPK